MSKSYNWFKKRTGKRIYRGEVSCPCHTCKDVESNGIVVRDENHAQYLAAASRDMDIQYKDYSVFRVYLNDKDRSKQARAKRLNKLAKKLNKIDAKKEK